MDEPHLLAAARYVERNPVSAGLAPSAEAWPWSSAGAHLRGVDDELVDIRPLLELIPYWRRYLSEPDADGLSEQLHLHGRTGRPLGAEDFIKGIERRLGRTLRPRKPGPRPKGLDN
jgi:putative transposase